MCAKASAGRRSGRADISSAVAEAINTESHIRSALCLPRTERMKRIIPLALGLAAVLASLPGGTGFARGQQVFQASADLVRLDVVVLDRDRRPVTGLTASDFTILEDQELREVAAFAAVTLPAATATAGAEWTLNSSSDVVTNARAENGRLVVIMLDHSIPAGAMALTAQAIARSAVDALGPNDLAAVVRSSPIAGEGISQNFTADRRRLIAAVESPFMGLTKGAPIGPSGGADRVPGLGESIACPCGICQWHAITRVADALTSGAGGRQKTLLFIGRDIVVQTSAAEDDCNVRVRDARTRALRALDRANTTVHSIDPSGLETLQASASGMTRMPPQRNLARQANLGVLPDYTGGRTVLNTNAPESVVPDIFSETQSYYLLGFQRSSDGRLDERRNIRVRVNRDGVTVRSRTGYYTSAAEADAAADGNPSVAALRGLLPMTDIPLRLGLTSRFRPDGSTQVGLLLSMTRTSDNPDRTFDVTVAVFDERARPMGSAHEVIDTSASAVRDTIETQSQMNLAPGRYEVRVGVAGTTSGVVGSVYGYVDVPDPSRSPLTLSDVWMEARGQVAAAPPLVSDAAPLPSTLRRSFGRTDAVRARLQVYQRPPIRAAVPLHVRVVDTSDRTVRESSQTLDAALFGAAGVADVRLTVPVGALVSGRYLLVVEAGSSGRVEGRQLEFAVQ